MSESISTQKSFKIPEYAMPTQIHELSSASAVFTAPISSYSRTGLAKRCACRLRNVAAVSLQRIVPMLCSRRLRRNGGISMIWMFWKVRLAFLAVVIFHLTKATAFLSETRTVRTIKFELYVFSLIFQSIQLVLISDSKTI